jgi:pheromone shutdown protein TraB
VLILKWQFGPVPEWRRWFVEPDMIWLPGTSHLSDKSATDVERVLRAIRPDNVVVELCYSRQVSRRAKLHNFHIINGSFIFKEALRYLTQNLITTA